MMEKDKYGHNVNSAGMEIKASTSSSGKTKIDFYDSCPAENENHKTIHINYDENTGRGTITDTTSGKTETTDIKCFLTTACMKRMEQHFDDGCYELLVLRWFRDNFVSPKDIKHYYTIAPQIVKEINKISNCNDIYINIYENIIKVCVNAINNDNYTLAYETYKKGILNLEIEFVRPVLGQRLVRTLKLLT